MESLRTLFRRLRTLLWTALALVIILAAVVVGIGKLLMPYSVQYKPQLEAWLSETLKQPVVLDSFTGEWKAFGPRIAMEGLSLLGTDGGDADDVIAIQRAALDIKPLNALISGRPLYTFRIIGADLSLVRDAEGRFVLSGLGVSGRGGGSDSGFSNLARVGEVRLDDSSFSYDDDVQDIHVQLIDVSGALQMDGDELAVEIQASVSDQRRIRIIGDLGATLLLTLDDDRKLADARWHMETGELMLSDFGEQLPAHQLKPTDGWLNAEMWGSWARGEAQIMDGVLDIRSVRMNSPEGLLELDHLNTRFHWRWMDRTQWRIDLADVQIEETGREWMSERISVERNLSGGLGVWVSADYLEAEFPLLVTHQAMSTFNARWPRAVPRKGRGVIRDFDLVINADKKLDSCTATFEGVDVYDWGKFPQIAGLSGTADMAGGEGTILTSGEDVRIDWSRNFSAPAVVDIPRCEVEITWGTSWQVDVRDCALENEAIKVHGRTRVAGAPDQGKPAIDVNVFIERAELNQLHDFWPQSIMKPAVTGWLRRGLVAGDVENARFMLTGDMDDWPFLKGEGNLLAQAAVRNAELDFHADWPAARGVTADVRFEGVGMTVDGSVSDIGGAAIDSARAHIANFKAPLLELDYSTAASLPQLVGFIDASPLLDNTQMDLAQFGFEGDADTQGRLTIPLGATPGDLDVAGTLVMTDSEFLETRSQVRLESLAGELEYTHLGINGAGLAALWNGYPAALELAADWNAEELFRVDMQGRFPAEVVIAAAQLADDSLLRGMTGDTHWDFRLAVSRLPDRALNEEDDGFRGGEKQAENETWLNVRSALEGVSLGLPSPLDKPVDAAWPLNVDYPVDAADTRVRATVGEDLQLLMEMGPDGTGLERAVIHFGPGDPELPGESRFDVSGEVGHFDLDTWMDVIIDAFDEGTSGDGLQFGQAHLSADSMILLNRRFEAVRMASSYEDEVLRLDFDSPDLAGELRYQRADDGAHSLAAEMDRLLMPNPEDQGMTMDSDPAKLPEMHFYVKHFRYLGLDMGETRIEAYPLANGLRIESVEASSPEMNFQARGDWVNTEEGQRSDFDIVMTSESMGSLISAMDLSSSLEGGQTMLRYDAWWPGPPAAFALSSLNGEMSFSVVDGRILNADPGAGRVLGLVSLTALPRRLAFDFRDVFESGFSFDQAHGSLLLENGTAHTRDFVLESTVANLIVEGSSDLVNQSFDYEMSVRPGVSQVLPVVGAIAAGPAGAAAGLALQGLFKDALGEAAEARYSVKGPWSDPEIERLEAAQRASAQATPPKEQAVINE